MQFAAELEGVVAGGAGNVIDDLRDRVRSLELWPLESTQAGKEISAKADARQAAGKGTGEAALVEPVARTRSIEIARQGRLVQAGIANSRFVHPTGTRGPRPVSAHHLGPGMNVRPPSILVLRKIFDRPRVVSEKIHSAYAAPLVDIEIHFSDRVVNLDVIGESVRNRNALGIISRETTAVAGDRSAGKRAAGDVQA